MAKKKKRSAGIGTWVIVGILVVGVAAAAGYYATSKSRFVTTPAQKPTVSITPAPAAAAPERTVYIYLPKDNKAGMYLARVAEQTREKGSILDVALKALIDTNKRGGIAEGLIPEGTKLLAPVMVQDGIATVNLSQDFKDNFSGGSDWEALTVNSIAHTLVSNSDGRIRSVRILVEGQAIETLGGHLELTDPVEADSTLLRPGGAK